MEMAHQNSKVCKADNPENDDSWVENVFKKNFKVKVIRITRGTKMHPTLGFKLDDVDQIQFDLTGIDLEASIANAIRRILISEVPTMAIEKVHIQENTSLTCDEILAHRLGLVPIKADPRDFVYKQEGTPDEGSENDTLEFHLKVRCTRNPNARDSTNPDDLYRDHNVTSKYLKWIPKGNQEKQGHYSPVHDDIILTKLNPGQALDLKLFCVKGIGKNHGKFSPVSTAFYNTKRNVRLLRPIVGEAAERLKRCFLSGVIELKHNSQGEKEAYVANTRNVLGNDNIDFYEDLKNDVVVEEVKDHFIFSVESTGVMKSELLVVEALKILQGKCVSLLEELNQRSCTEEALTM